LIARLPVGGQFRLAGLADAGRVHHRPIFDVEVIVPRQFQCLPLARRRQRDDKVETRQVVPPFPHLFEAARPVAREFDPQLLADRDGKAIDLKVVLHAGRLHIAGGAVHLLHQPLGHRRADGIVIAAEKHRMGHLADQDHSPD